MCKRMFVLSSIMIFLAGLLVGDSRARSVRTRLSGSQEVPAVSTAASGEFRGEINRAETELTYVLEFSGLEGAVTQSHIHFGQKSVNGGISVFLCGTAASPGPTGTPVCPASGRVSRTVTAADVIGPAGQGISAGEFVKLLEALRSGLTYANVHSTKWPGGEIRGQIKDDND